MVIGVVAAALLLTSGPAQELVKGEKDDPRLAKMSYDWQLDRIEKGAKEQVVALEGDPAELVRLIEARGGKVLVRTKTIVTAIVGGKDVISLLDEPAITRMEQGPWIVPEINRYAQWRRVVRSSEFSPLPAKDCKESLQSGSLSQVHLGAAPLTRAYTGKGVLVAVIESELPDFRHPDFRNADGTTRFHAIWDATAEGTGMAGIPYGRVYGQAELNKLLKSGAAEQMVFGEPAEHPTNSCGAAIGNGRGSGLYRGVAPEAHVMAVRTHINNIGVMNAAAAIYREADRLGMPCVITLQLLSDQLQGRAEDGRDLASIGISELVEEKAGRLFFSAAGNNGEAAKLHWSPELVPGEEKRVWGYNVVGKGSNHFTSSILLEGSDRDSVEFQVSAVTWTDEGFKVTKSSEWLSAAKLTESGPVRFDLTSVTAGAPAGLKVRCVSKWNPEESAVVSVHYDVVTHAKADVTPLLEMKFRGRGKPEFWTEGYGPMVGVQHFPLDAFYPYLKNVVMPADLGVADNERTITSPSAGRSVIAAGAYSDVGNGVASYTQPGGLYHGEYAPLVLSPTDVIAANSLDSPQPDDKLFDKGRYRRYSGTSCATPMLAGAGALFLEKHPRATVKQFVAAVKAAAVGDELTGPVPSPRCGYGRLDYFRLMQQ
jgi:hypothetical protein